MEPEKMAVVGVTLVVVVVGLVIGVSFLTFPTGNGGGDEVPLTKTTQDRDLLELGLEAPDSWTFEMSDDTTLTLSDLEGQVVLVDLMASWCSSCATQNNYLETVHENLGGTAVIVSLTVDTSDTTSMMADYKSNNDLPWAHGVDDRKFLDHFGISSVPTMILIDSDGFFRYYHVGLWTPAAISSTVASIVE